MEIDSTGFVNKLTKLRNNLQATVAVRLSLSARDMANEISSRNPTVWKPAVGKYGKYFAEPHNPLGNSPTIFDALEDLKNQISISTEGGNVTMGMGDPLRLTSLFGYWDLFEGYGLYARSRGGRAGGSNTYGFVPSAGVGKSGEGFSKEGLEHPGVLPSYMFRDTAIAFRPIITRQLKKDIAYLVNKIGSN